VAPILEAGPHEARPIYDPNAAAATSPEDVELEEVGKGAAMPWETDGRRWHTLERITTEGKPCRWEGAILDWIDERVHELGAFGETNWNNRSVVEIPAATKSQGWFLHAMTGQEWLLRLVFRVGKNAFKDADLVRRLGIRPLNETPGLEVYGDGPRVWVTNHKGPWQSVTVLAHRLSEVDTPAFRAFLQEAAAAFHANLKRLNTKVEDYMPWKINGERWHLGEKGFPSGKKVKWDRSLLPRLLGLVHEVEPELQVRWDARDHIALRVPGFGKSWAYWRTKEPAGLVCRFFGKKGQFNLTRIDGLGVTPRLDTHRADADVLWLQFQQLDQLQPARLKEILTEHLGGFREAFGKNAP
jgi:excinuclease ABC subunit A